MNDSLAPSSLKKPADCEQHKLPPGSNNRKSSKQCAFPSMGLWVTLILVTLAGLAYDGLNLGKLSLVHDSADVQFMENSIDFQTYYTLNSRSTLHSLNLRSFSCPFACPNTEGVHERVFTLKSRDVTRTLVSASLSDFDYKSMRMCDPRKPPSPQQCEVQYQVNIFGIIPVPMYFNIESENLSSDSVIHEEDSNGSVNVLLDALKLLGIDFSASVKELSPSQLTLELDLEPTKSPDPVSISWQLSSFSSLDIKLHALSFATLRVEQQLSLYHSECGLLQGALGVPPLRLHLLSSPSTIPVTMTNDLLTFGDKTKCSKSIYSFVRAGVLAFAQENFNGTFPFTVSTTNDRDNVVKKLLGTPTWTLNSMWVSAISSVASTCKTGFVTMEGQVAAQLCATMVLTILTVGEAS